MTHPTKSAIATCGSFQVLQDDRLPRLLYLLSARNHCFVNSVKRNERCDRLVQM